MMVFLDEFPLIFFLYPPFLLKNRQLNSSLFFFKNKTQFSFFYLTWRHLSAER